MRILRLLYELPPKEVIHKVRRRISRRTGSTFDLQEIAESQKHLRFQRLYDFLSRYETIIQRHHPHWGEIQFEAERVLEIGCGPLLGWGPLAVFLGAERYVACEPLFNKDVLTDQNLAERYFRGLHKDLSAIYGPRMTFDEFRLALQERCEIHNHTLLESHIEGEFGVMLSNSCLEHVFPLDRTIALLKELSSPNCRFVHLVDFGNHRATRNPFSGMYSLEPETYFEKYGRAINLTRPSEMLQMFRQAGYEASLIPYYETHENYEEQVIPYWQNRYSDEELFLKAALVAGPLGNLPTAP
jgi:hypothetical protein